MNQKKIGVEASFLDGCAVDDGYVYLASQLDDLDPEKYRHTRMTGFQKLAVGGKNAPNGWFYHDLKLHIVSVCVKKATPTIGRRLCALSREGDVEIFSGKLNKGIIEKIPGAGLLSPDASSRGGIAGYVSHIREIGASLYVCGVNGQVYRRPPEGGWRAIDSGLFKPMTANDLEITNRFMCIDGNDEEDIYAVGMQGLICHYNGWEWKAVKSPVDEHLLWVRCCGKGEVWICGYNGALLKGSAARGFRDVSSVEDNLTWWCLGKFGDKVYLSAMEGLHAWDGEKIAPVKTGLKPEPETWRVDVDGAGKALWSFGIKDLVWFDGSQWQRLHHPDNPKIGES